MKRDVLLYKFITNTCSVYTYKISENTPKNKISVHNTKLQVMQTRRALTTSSAAMRPLHVPHVLTVYSLQRYAPLCAIHKQHEQCLYQLLKHNNLLNRLHQFLFVLKKFFSSAESTLRTFMNGFRPCCVLSVHPSLTRPCQLKTRLHEILPYISVLFRCLNESF